MNDERMFDHRPDPELGTALRRALDPPGDEREFVARVMARYDSTLAAATVPTWEVLAGWARRGIAAAVVAAVLTGFLVARAVATPDAAAEFDAAMAPPVTSGPGLTALVTASEPPDASVVFASLVEPR